MYYGLYDWLSEPTRGPNECCQCWSLKCKKFTLLLTLFAFTIALSILVLLLWTRLGFMLPVEVIAVVVLIQFLTFLISVPAYFSEHKYRWILPSVITNFVALAVFVVIALAYLVILIANKVQGKGGEINDYNRSVFLPGIPSSGLGVPSTEGMTQNAIAFNLLGHAMFLIPIQLYLCSVTYGIYSIFKHRSTIQYPSKPTKVYYAPNSRRTPHNLVFLENNVDDVLYGPESGKKKQQH